MIDYALAQVAWGHHQSQQTFDDLVGYADRLPAVLGDLALSLKPGQGNRYKKMLDHRDASTWSCADCRQPLAGQADVWTVNVHHEVLLAQGTAVQSWETPLAFCTTCAARAIFNVWKWRPNSPTERIPPSLDTPCANGLSPPTTGARIFKE